MLFIGIYMILCPSTFMAVTLSVFSVYMLFDGIRGIVSIFRFRNMANGIRSAVLAKSIAAIGAGVTIIAISIARPDILIPVFVYIAGAVFLIAGIVNLADFIILSRSGIRFGYLGVEVVLLFLLAILQAYGVDYGPAARVRQWGGGNLLRGFPPRGRFRRNCPHFSLTVPGGNDILY